MSVRSGIAVAALFAIAAAHVVAWGLLVGLALGDDPARIIVAAKVVGAVVVVSALLYVAARVEWRWVS